MFHRGIAAESKEAREMDDEENLKHRETEKTEREPTLEKKKKKKKKKKTKKKIVPFQLCQQTTLILATWIFLHYTNTFSYLLFFQKAKPQQLGKLTNL
jgi:cell division septal protein FtsQ